jgi:hypothetical protein
MLSTTRARLAMIDRARRGPGFWFNDVVRGPVWMPQAIPAFRPVGEAEVALRSVRSPEDLRVLSDIAVEMARAGSFDR